jgi:hypothetical protein
LAVSEKDVQEQVKAILSVDAFDVASGWPRICASAVRSAYGLIYRALAARGYSPAQVAAWDALDDLWSDIAVWFAIVKGGLTKDFDAKYLQLFDRRGELNGILLTIGGVIVGPAVSAVASGKLATADNNFSLADDDLQDWYVAGMGPIVPPSPRP